MPKSAPDASVFMRDFSFAMHPLSIFHHSFLMRRQIFKGILKNRDYVRGRVLDFGCGEKPYAHLFEVEAYVGVDFKSSGHDNSTNDVDIFWDGKTIPVPDASFDSVISTEVFEHLFHPEDALAEIRRILKPGWHAVITVPFSIHEHEVPYDFARYTHYGLKSLLAHNGFEIVWAERYGGYFEVIMQYAVWFSWKITETRFPWITLALRIIFSAPTIVVCNLLGLMGPKKQGGMCLTNCAVVRKNGI